MKKIISKFKQTSPNKTIVDFFGIAKYIPLILLSLFFFGTIFMFRFGPYKWDIAKPLYLYGFLLMAVLMLIIGYVIGIKYTLTKTKKINNNINININKILWISYVIFFIIYFPTLYARTGKWYPDIITGIFNTGDAYRNSYIASLASKKIIEYSRIILSPFIYCINPLLLIYWPDLQKKTKIIGVLTMILTVFMGISQGINKYFADFVFQISTILSIILCSNFKTTSIFRKIKIISIIFILCTSFIVYYKLGMNNRIEKDYFESTGEILKDPDSKMLEYGKFSFAIEKEKNIFSWLPNKIKSPFMYITSYLTHGYMGLSMAMEEKFTSSYGFGFSTFFRHNFLKIIGKTEIEEKLYERTYMNKIHSKGWYTGMVWSSFFIFSASDIGFVGTLVLVLIIGYFFAISWKDTLVSKNVFACICFFSFCTMICYFSANNQLFQSGEFFMSTTVYLFLWAMSKITLFKKVKN